jgi:dTDP-4-amino-4,6-dideoxygalactose transaminase
VTEDAAQAPMPEYKEQLFGNIADLGTYIFHGTITVISGRGGTLRINDPDLVLNTEVIREEGTDHSQFFRTEIDKYT